MNKTVYKIIDNPAVIVFSIMSIIALTVWLCYTPMEEKPVIETITFTDGTVVKSKGHASYESGMTRYFDQNSKKVEVPTITIKSIK